jgi:hypothetical protein
MKKIAFAFSLICSILVPRSALADEFRPALLEITVTGQGWYSVLWKVPLQNGRAPAISLVLPAHFVRIGPASKRTFQGSAIEESTWRQMPYAIGTTAAFWTLQRSDLFIG